MFKAVRLKFLKIKYSGDSIGDDIRIEIETLGKFLRVDKKIKAGATADINREIGRFETDRDTIEVDVLATVTDKDLRFNDVGSTKGNIKIKTAITQVQPSSIKIQVNETRSKSGKPWGTKTAVFEIILEAEISDVMRHISFEQGDGGWTKVILKRKEIALPAYLKVKLKEQNFQRQRFIVLEGPWRNEEASVVMGSGDIPYLESKNNQTVPVHLIYSFSKNTLKFGKKIYKTKRHPEDVALPKKGVYDLEIPDFAHAPGQHYLDSAVLAKVWFPIGHDRSGRYLHTGKITRGCITLTEIEKWDDLCKILMKARKGDDMSIGTLEII